LQQALFHRCGQNPEMTHGRRFVLPANTMKKNLFRWRLLLSAGKRGLTDAHSLSQTCYMGRVMPDNSMTTVNNYRRAHASRRCSSSSPFPAATHAGRWATGERGKRSHAASCVWKYPIWGCLWHRWALFHGFAQAPTLFTVEARLFPSPATRAGSFDPP
jgi:hypothetical protein